MIDQFLKMIPLDALENKIAESLESKQAVFITRDPQGKLAIMFGELDRVEGKEIIFIPEKRIKISDLIKQK